MKQHLSSRFTYVYKFGIPGVWAIIVLWATIVMFRDTGNAASFLVLGFIVPVVWLTWDVKFVSYDTKHISVSNGIAKRIYEIKNLKKIRKPNNFFGPYFNIELIGEDGTVDQFKFLARLSEQWRYTLSGRLSGRILELQNIHQQRRWER